MSSDLAVLDTADPNARLKQAPLPQPPISPAHVLGERAGKQTLAQGSLPVRPPVMVNSLRNFTRIPSL